MNARKLGFEVADLVTIGFGLIVAGIALAFRAQLQDPQVFARYLLVAFGYAGILRMLARIDTRPMVMGWVRAVSISTAIPYMFLQLGDVLPYVSTRTFEAELVAIDTAIFGVEPIAWMEGLLNPVLVDLAQGAYALYYPLFLVGLTLLFRKRMREFYSYLAGTSLTQCMTYLGYFLVPAVSPYRAAEMPEFHGLFHFTREVQGIWIQPWLGPAIHQAESCPWDCFPSGHTAGTVMVSLAMWKWNRKVFWVILPFQAMLIFATVYLRYHYVIDVLVGIPLGVLALRLGIALNERMQGKDDAVARGTTPQQATQA